MKKLIGNGKWRLAIVATLLLGVSGFMQVSAATSPVPPPGCYVCIQCPTGFGIGPPAGGCYGCCQP